MASRNLWGVMINVRPNYMRQPMVLAHDDEDL